MKRRAFTMVEMVITVALTGLVVGVVASLYGFAATRLSDSYTQAQLYDQVSEVADSMEDTIRNSTGCTTADSGSTLDCGMPANGIDTDGDGMEDAYYPDHVDANGVEQYSVGRGVWYFAAADNGAYSKSGSGLIWRADSNHTGDPMVSDNDLTYMYYRGGARVRNPLVTRISCSVDAAAHTVTFTVFASSRIGSQSTETSDTAGSRFASITRTIQWRD